MHDLLLGATELRARDRATLRARLRRRITQDFADGNVAMVGGWMLSRVEAQLCAIAYMNAAGNA
jgi:hypothetical protein